EEECRQALVSSLGRAWVQFKDQLAAKAGVIAKIDDRLVVDLDDPSTPTTGLVQPVFYERLKPQYTIEAQLANVTATVEIEAVFRDNGQVTDLEIIRWAGFGLDESALQTAARLRFKPAERNGRPVSVRALVRYNFKG